MSLAGIVAVVPITAGCFFFLAGTLGLLRLPDLFTRLHALTKADNLGLGLVAAGMAIHIGCPWAALKIFFIWLFTLLASSTSCYLIARFAREQGEEAPGKEGEEA